MELSSSAAAMPEKMADFFDARHEGYDLHMQNTVLSFHEFYDTVAAAIPLTDDVIHILDIGCGTGLEIGPILQRAPNAMITGVDVSSKMLDLLRKKYTKQMNQIRLIQGSYLTEAFAESAYDYVVSVMTLHHLIPEQKVALYRKLGKALVANGSYIEGDYIVDNIKEQQLIAEYREKTHALPGAEVGAYHIDIPMSVGSQRRLLLEAGFKQVTVVWQKGEAAITIAS